jgi:trans-aconitate methyltransferase
VSAPRIRAVALAVALACSPRDTPAGAARAPDVHYEPTSPEIVDAMLRLADVGPQDVVYDLGCGDGRIVVAAAQRFGARGVGIDIDPQRVAESRENVRRAGVEGKVEIREGDLFEADVRGATAVMLYLWPGVNLRLRPKLLAELRPGTRVVSHSHDMGDWKPDRSITVGGSKLHLWTIPPRAASR